MSSDRQSAIMHATQYFDTRDFKTDLAHLVGYPTESQSKTGADALAQYLSQAIAPRLQKSGFDCTIVANPIAGGGPILVGKRVESPALPTVLIYGHGDVVYGQAGQWRDDLTPFELVEDSTRYYGRGTADNKGQHLINIAAIECVLAVRGTLGFNVTFLIEMSEEIGSTGLQAFCIAARDLLAADVLIAADGPRLQADTPTIFLGARGSVNFDLEVDLRDGGNHSGNWGGLLADPAMILVQALSVITDARGQILIPQWRPDSLTPAVQADLAVLPMENGDGAQIDPDWGETSLSLAERVFGWNSFAILAMQSGDPAAPQNAISGSAKATCQLRFVVGTDEADILPALRRHLDANGFARVQIHDHRGVFTATRQNRNSPWVSLVEQSLHATTGRAPHVLPNLAGWIPNHCFSDILGLPTVWVPHSYRGCSQHAPNEHVLKSVCRDALQGMTGVFWDIGVLTEKSPTEWQGFLNTKRRKA
jgi:acetylornithine deacetylase/succinyl-diaminopimelate desuccinylase-like protein